MGVPDNRVVDRLILRGKEDFNSPVEAHPIKPEKPSDLSDKEYQAAITLLNDLKCSPHAFVIGCIMDRQINADQAWLIPYRLSQRLGSPGEPTFGFRTLLELSEDEIQRKMEGPPSLHRFPRRMGHNVYAALQHIAEKYSGRAERIWTGRLSSAELVYRFLEFEGIALKIATMAANLLVRCFKVPVSDYSSIDISPDRHVRRVLYRLGLAPKQASTQLVIYRARDLHPEFPGLLDFPAFEIGRKWCKTDKPNCHKCFMEEICPTAKGLNS